MIAHDKTCGCRLCRDVRARAHPVEQVDCDRLAWAWGEWISTSDGEVAKLRAGAHGNPGSPRWTTLQAIAATRIARAGSAPDQDAEHRMLCDLVRTYPMLGVELEAALRAAYRRALRDAGILPPDHHDPRPRVRP